MIKEIGMDDIYGQFFRTLGLVMKISSILLQLRGNSKLTLLYDVDLNISDHSMPVRIYQSSYQNTE